MREEMDDQMVERGTGTTKFGHLMVLDHNNKSPKNHRSVPVFKDSLQSDRKMAQQDKGPGDISVKNILMNRFNHSNSDMDFKR